jgi:peptidoglycan/xylan/chitin deacetylase (PgdA/CDA1 family)
MLTLPLTLLSPAGERGRLTILIFHRVVAESDALAPGEPDIAGFEKRMRWVRSWFNVLPLVRAVDLLFEGRLPARALSITFDDGYADNEELAAPVLERLGLSATFFITTGFLDGGAMWNDRVIEGVRQCRLEAIDLEDIGLGQFNLRTLGDRRRVVDTVLKAIKHREPRDREAAVSHVLQAAGVRTEPALMMSSEQVRSLVRRGMDVGAHTMTHPILTRLTEGEARAEIVGGKARLEELVDRPVQLFAYPNGVPNEDYATEHVSMVRQAGFSAAVSTAWGAATKASDRFQLPRFTPWDQTRLRYCTRLAWNLSRRDHAVA